MHFHDLRLKYMPDQADSIESFDPRDNYMLILKNIHEHGSYIQKLKEKVKK